MTTDTEQTTETQDEVEQKPKVETREMAVQRLHAEIHGARQRLTASTAEYNEAREEAKAAKKTMESDQLRLNGIIAELDGALHDSDWQPRLPFPGDDASDGVDPAKTAPLSELGLPPAMQEKLEEADLETVADVEQAIAKDKLRKIDGIGQSAIDRIADEIVTWRDANGYGDEDADDEGDE